MPKPLLEKDPSEHLGLMVTDELAKQIRDEGADVPVISLGSCEDLEGVAARLFEALREADERGFTRFYAQAFVPSGVGEAIMNRLLKASSERRI